MAHLALTSTTSTPADYSRPRPQPPVNSPPPLPVSTLVPLLRPPSLSHHVSFPLPLPAALFRVTAAATAIAAPPPSRSPPSSSGTNREWPAGGGAVKGASWAVGFISAHTSAHEREK